MEKPILFNTDMVRAILADKKTQTRRPMKPQPIEEPLGIGKYNPLRADKKGIEYPGGIQYGIWGEGWDIKAPYAVGDVLWVRETWQYLNGGESNDGYIYRVDKHIGGEEGMKWRPSIHMPREAARLFLRVTDVKAQRVQELTNDEAISEGMMLYEGWQTPAYKEALEKAQHAGTKPPLGATPRNRFMHNWDAIYSKRGLGWASNPYVWVISFEQIEEPEKWQHK